MGLGLNTQTNANIVPHIRYDARAGRLFRADRTQDASGLWTTELVDITTPPPAFIMDLATIEVGWVHYTTTGPDFRMVRMGQPLPAQPSKDHRQAFRVRVNAPKLLGGTREFVSAAKAVINAMDALHTTWEQAPERTAGLVPVVRLSGTTPITSKGPQGTTTNYAPRFEIIKWTERPGDLPIEAAMPSSPPPSSPPAASMRGRHVPPPSMAPVADDTIPWDDATVVSQAHAGTLATSEPEF
jgi:hypothetical protein